MKVIGLTGGIGSGKTAVSDYLAEKGYILIDADEVAREIVAPGSEGLAELVAHFGSGILLEGGGLDRARLAEIAFATEGARAALNSIMHARIIRRMGELAAGHRDAGAKALFLAAPLLFEAGMAGMADEVWLVDADEGIRLERVKKRDNLSEAHIRSRMAAQMPSGEKRALADVVIDNSGGLGELYRKLDDILRERL
ncbi:MAG: dephospho-CoA kinase [Clostridiales Family XIII bacterium]|jgi:dephospho-CoA kinase|nr:dephospho-CoA kinase [Clostridiales Family XIII bacterium]